MLSIPRDILVTTPYTVKLMFASCVGTTDAWSAPPIHKLQIMTEAYFAEYEAHEKVEQYLHKHLSGGLTDKEGRRVHERIREECEQVRWVLDCVPHGVAASTVPYTALPPA